MLIHGRIKRTPDADTYDLPSSEKRFLVELNIREELSSVEGPNALKPTLEEIEHNILIAHRVSRVVELCY